VCVCVCVCVCGSETVVACVSPHALRVVATLPDAVRTQLTFDDASGRLGATAAAGLYVQRKAAALWQLFVFHLDVGGSMPPSLSLSHPSTINHLALSTISVSHHSLPLSINHLSLSSLSQPHQPSLSLSPCVCVCVCVCVSCVCVQQGWCRELRFSTRLTTQQVALVPLASPSRLALLAATEGL
jgi:hypothetical protein